MSARRDFRLEALVDFPDDALTCEFPVTPAHVDSMMATLESLGVGRVIWGYYGDGHGGYFLPSISGAEEDPTLGYDQNQWKAYAQTLDVLGNPLRVAAEAAHRHGIELYAYFKPYETGVAMYLPEGSPQARLWGRLYHIGGYLTWLDPFVVKNPHLRIKRRTDDLRPGVESAAIRTIRLTKKDDSPTRVTAERLQIWTSDLNHRYQQTPVRFDFSESVEPSPREVRDVYGNLITRKGDRVRVLTLNGLNLTDRYVLITTDFTDGPADFENTWDRLLTCFDADGREIPGVYATGTAIWFPEWEDFIEGGLIFDTGRGPEVTTLDLPNHRTGREELKGSDVHFAPGQKKVQGCIAFARGRNAYLPGAVCETEPEVQRFWLSCIDEMLEAGVDGVEFRVENHSSHTDTPEDYGFNQVVLDRVPKGSRDLLADVTRVRMQAYTEFMRKAKAQIAAAGRRMRVNLNVDWFRPASERPGSRKLAYPANIEFDWRTWLRDGLLDEAMLRPFATPFDRIFKDDRTAQEMIEKCRQRGVPVTVNRYVWVNQALHAEFKRVLEDGRFSGFVLYETWAYMQFIRDGRCVMAGGEQRPSPQMALWEHKTETSRLVQEVCRHWREVRGNLR